MKRELSLCGAILVVLIGAMFAQADAPRLVNYQGVLKDVAGHYLDGNYDLTFRIYPTPGPGAAPMWAETQMNVLVNDGVFNVLLGAVTNFPSTLFDYSELWLGIQVEQDVEIAPRLRLTSVPWALRAVVADSALVCGSGGGGSGDGWNVVLPHMFAAVPGSLGIGMSGLRGKVSIRGETGTALYAQSGNAIGVYGSGSTYGVYGNGSFTSGSVGVLGRNSNSEHFGHLGTETAGAYGESHGGNKGYLGGAYGAWGQYSTTNFGYLGGSAYGAYGERSSNGNNGVLGEATSGVRGNAGNQSSYGVAAYNTYAGTALRGYSTGGTGVEGVNSTAGTSGYLARSDFGAYGVGNNVPGVRGQSSSSYGIYGTSTSNHGVYGASSSGAGVYGTSTTGYAGRFNGNLKVENGQVITPQIQITGGADLSEAFAIGGGKSGLVPAPGMLVCVDSERPGELVVSDRAYDKRVAGVISGAGGVKPGVVMGQQGTAADGLDPVALTGRVYCWADATAAPIEPGDLLTTSAVPGHAMKADRRVAQPRHGHRQGDDRPRLGTRCGPRPGQPAVGGEP